MQCTATKKFVVSMALAVASAALGAAEYSHPPKFLIEPVLGLKVERSDARLDPLPEHVRRLCAQMADNDMWTARQWIFGSASSDGKTYYLVNGYFMRRHPTRGQHRYHQPDQGGMYIVSGSDCGGDPARDVFDVRDFEEIPKAVLDQLADDLVTRLIRVYGSADRLRAQLRQQGIESKQLTPELQRAFKPYF